jgi:hypothetical protein
MLLSVSHVVAAGAAASQTTDAPVWWLVVATTVLASATVGIAVGAFFALRQLKEVRQDRHVHAFLEMGNRWQGAEMTEALKMEVDYTADELSEMFARVYAAGDTRSLDPNREKARRREAKDARVLLRVPYFFEDVAMIAKVGGLEDKALSDYVGGLAADEWRKWGQTIKTMQEDKGYAWAFQEFELFATSQPSADEDDWRSRIALGLRRYSRFAVRLSMAPKQGLPPA